MAIDFGQILAAIEALRASTAALAHCAEDPELDAAERARSCAQQLDGLKALLGGGTIPEVIREAGVPPADTREQLLKALLSLEAQTRSCMEALSACRDRTEGELQALRQTRKAVTAYGTPR